MNFNLMEIITRELQMQPKDLLPLIPVFIFIAIAAYIDQKEMRIPNQLNYGMMMFRFAFIPFLPLEAKYLIGFIIGGAIIMIPAMIILKPMGGDIKFAAALGLWVGDVKLVLTLSVAVILFVVYGVFIKKLNRKESAPFAPFMSLGFLIITAVGFFV